VAPDELWVRFANLGAEDQRDGARLESLWPAGLRAWENSPLIGYGLGTNSLIIQRAIGADTPVHSAPLAVAMELGVIGLALYLLFLIAPVSKAIKNLFEAKRLHKADSNVFTQLNIWMMAAMASIMVTWFKGSGMECSKLLFLFLGIIMALNQKRLLILYKPK
jgi:O-antigen ligase